LPQIIAVSQLCAFERGLGRVLQVG